MELTLNRRNMLLSTVGVAAMGLVGCDSTTTVQNILDWLKTNCNFATDAQSIINVILTIVSTINAAAGAAATVAVNVAEQVEKAVCDAVTAQVAQMKAEHKFGASQKIAVVVRGQTVVGTVTE